MSSCCNMLAGKVVLSINEELKAMGGQDLRAVDRALTVDRWTTYQV